MSYSKDDLLKFGREASFKLFAEEAPLTSTIIKIASDNDLNPEQIKRVCHAANQSTMLQIYQSDGENTQEFDVASADDVISNVSSTKQASEIESNDYLSAPPAAITSISKFASLKVSSFDFDDEFDRIKSYKEKYNSLTKQAQKLSSKLRDANEDTEIHYYKYAGTMDVLYKVMKQHIMKGRKVASLVTAALASMPGKLSEAKEVLYSMLKRLASDMSISAKMRAGLAPQLSMLKVADAVDRDLISTGMRAANNVVPLKIQNGSEDYIHALSIVYDDLKSINDSDRMAEDILNKLTVVRKQLGELKPPEGKWY